MRRSLFFAAILPLVLIFGSAHGASLITPELEQRMTEAAPSEFIRINIAMEGQVDRGYLDLLTAGMDRAERRKTAVSELKRLADDSQAGLLSYLAAVEGKGQARRVRSLWVNNVICCQMMKDVIRDLSNREGISFIDWDEPKDYCLNPERGGWGKHGTIEWNVIKINAPAVWAKGYTGKGIVVGHIDTGVDYNHTDLNDHMWTNSDEIPGNGVDDDGNGYVDDYYGYDFYSNDGDPMDGDGHGTHTAGTVAGDGTAGDTTGVAPDAQIMGLRVSSWCGSAWDSDVWEAIQYAIDNGADLVTMSMGCLHAWGVDRVLHRHTFNSALGCGMPCAVAAGNERPSPPPPDNVRTPGDCPPPWLHPDQTMRHGLSAVITVGATDSMDSSAWFSSIGPVSWKDVSPWLDYPYSATEMGLIDPDIAAPGVDVVSLQLGGGYSGPWNGTSMATPHVAGTMALMLESNPDLSAAEVDSLIEMTSIELGPAGKDTCYGAGRIDALAAVHAVPYVHGVIADNARVYTYNDYSKFSYGWWVRYSNQWVEFRFEGIRKDQIPSDCVDVEFNLGVTQNLDGNQGLDGLVDVVVNPGTNNAITFTDILLDNHDPRNVVYPHQGGATYLAHGKVKIPKCAIRGDSVVVRILRHTDTYSAPYPASGRKVPIDMTTVPPTVPLGVYENDDAHTVHINVNTIGYPQQGSVATSGQVMVKTQALDIAEYSLFGDFAFFRPPDPWAQPGLILYPFTVIAQEDLVHISFTSDDLLHETLDNKKIEGHSINFTPQEIGHLSTCDTGLVTAYVQVPIGQHEGQYLGYFRTVACNGASDSVIAVLHIDPVADLDIPDYAGNLSANTMELWGLPGLMAVGSFDLVNPNMPDNNYDPFDGPGNCDLEILTWEVTPLVDPFGAIVIPPESVTVIIPSIPGLGSGQAVQAYVQVSIPVDVASNLLCGGAVIVTAQGPEGPVSDEFTLRVILDPLRGGGLSGFWGVPNEKGNDLRWADFGFGEVGFNLYRSDLEDAGFMKLNETLLTRTSYTDSNVSADLSYHYKLGLVFADQTEIMLGPISVTALRRPPTTYALLQNYPNPFSHQTAISYQLPASVQTALRIYDATGRLVRTLVDAKQAAGYYSVSWDRTDSSGKEVRSGVYFYRLAAGDFTATRKMTPLR